MVAIFLKGSRIYGNLNMDHGFDESGWINGGGRNDGNGGFGCEPEIRTKRKR